MPQVVLLWGHVSSYCKDFDGNLTIAEEQKLERNANTDIENFEANSEDRFDLKILVRATWNQRYYSHSLTHQPT